MTNIHAENAEAEDLSNLTSKRVLVNPSDEILAKFAEQTCTDLGQKGEILMSLGVGTEGDDGLTCDEANKAEKNLNIVAEKLGCSLKMLRSKAIGRGVESRDYLLRKRLEDENDFSEIRVAVVGNVDAGKTKL
jgi:GTPase